MKLLEMVNGKKTYLLAALSILWGLTGLLTGWLPQEEALQCILTGLTAFSLRSAIAKK